jgi:hypothetical protein
MEKGDSRLADGHNDRRRLHGLMIILLELAKGMTNAVLGITATEWENVGEKYMLELEGWKTPEMAFVYSSKGGRKIKFWKAKVIGGNFKHMSDEFTHMIKTYVSVGERRNHSKIKSMWPLNYINVFSLGIIRNSWSSGKGSNGQSTIFYRILAAAANGSIHCSTSTVDGPSKSLDGSKHMYATV